jgi:hypothetical protein
MARRRSTHMFLKLTPGAWHCRQLYANNRNGSRSWAVEEAPAADARPANGSLSQDHHGRARVHPEHSAAATTSSALTKHIPCR